MSRPRGHHPGTAEREREGPLQQIRNESGLSTYGVKALNTPFLCSLNNKVSCFLWAMSFRLVLHVPSMVYTILHKFTFTLIGGGAS